MKTKAQTRNLCSIFDDMNNGIIGADTYGHLNEVEEQSMLAEDAEFMPEDDDMDGFTADDADELGEVYGGENTAKITGGNHGNRF